MLYTPGFYEKVEQKIREEFKDDERTKKLTSEEFADLIHAATKDAIWRVMRKQERTEKMKYDAYHLCKELCKVYRIALECMFASKDPKQMEKFLRLAADKCYVSYFLEEKTFYYARIQMYRDDRITVEVNSLFAGIHGFVDERGVHEEPLSEKIVKELDLQFGDYWDEIKNTREFYDVETEHPNIERVRIHE